LCTLVIPRAKIDRFRVGLEMPGKKGAQDARLLSSVRPSPQTRSRLRKRKEVGWIFGACRACAPPRLRQSLAALGFGYGLNAIPFHEAR
jgi:hypothetical protein